MEGPITLTELYKKYPVLEDIAIRLEVSKRDSDAKNSQRKETTNRSQDNESQQSKQRRSILAPCEHARILKFFSNGSWSETYHQLQSGRPAFEENLQRIMMRNPDAIQIQINSSSKINSISKPQEIEVVFNKEAKVPTAVDQQPDNAVFKQIQEQLNGLQEIVKSQPKVDNSNIPETLMQLEFAQKLKDIQHTNELETLKRDHRYEKDNLVREYEKQIEELNDTIAELEDEIEDYEQEKLETEESLNGIEKRIEEAKNPAITDIFGKVLARATEHLIKGNAEGLGKIFNISPSEITEYFEGKEDSEKTPANTTETSFKEVTDLSGYSELPADKKVFADAFIKLTTHAEVADLNAIVSAFQLFLNDDGSVNKLILTEMYKTGKTISENLKSDNNE